MTSGPRQILGVLGGLGPLASAEFLRTVYALAPPGPDQGYPIVHLLSDPTFPDRTTALLAGETDELRERLETSLARLLDLGATRIVICCFTLHAVLPEVAPELRRPVVSLVETALKEVAERGGRHLLLATRGSREVGLFEGARAWPGARQLLVWPGEADQDRLHELLYRLKAGEEPARVADEVAELARRSGAAACVAGCTELHLLSRLPPAPGRPAWVDPLITLARRFAAEPRVTPSA